MILLAWEASMVVLLARKIRDARRGRFRRISRAEGWGHFPNLPTAAGRIEGDPTQGHCDFREGFELDASARRIRARLSWTRSAVAGSKPRRCCRSVSARDPFELRPLDLVIVPGWIEEMKARLAAAR
jgi:hypothetical protein